MSRHDCVGLHYRLRENAHVLKRQRYPTAEKERNLKGCSFYCLLDITNVLLDNVSMYSEIIGFSSDFTDLLNNINLSDLNKVINLNFTKYKNQLNLSQL